MAAAWPVSGVNDFKDFKDFKGVNDVKVIKVIKDFKVFKPEWHQKKRGAPWAPPVEDRIFCYIGLSGWIIC